MPWRPGGRWERPGRRRGRAEAGNNSPAPQKASGGWDGSSRPQGRASPPLGLGAWRRAAAAGGRQAEACARAGVWGGGCSVGAEVNPPGGGKARRGGGSAQWCGTRSRRGVAPSQAVGNASRSRPGHFTRTYRRAGLNRVRAALRRLDCREQNI